MTTLAVHKAELAATMAQIAALQEQLTKLEEEKTYYLDEYETERERAEVAEAQSQKAAWRIQQLTNQLVSGGADPDGKHQRHHAAQHPPLNGPPLAVTACR